MPPALKITCSAAAAVLALSACAGDETATTQPDPFCDAYLEAEQALLFSPADPSGWESDVTQALATLTAAAPDELAPAVEGQANAITTAIAAGGPEQVRAVFATEQFKEDDRVTDQWRTANCGYEAVDVTAVDWSFSGMPSELGGGGHSFKLTNAGQEVHELVLLKVQEGVTESAQELLESADVGSKVTNVTGELAFPGESNTAFAVLDPGRYLIVCAIPLGTTADNFDEALSGDLSDQAPHFTLGMVGEVTVGQ